MQIVRTYKFKLYRSKKNRHLQRRIGIAGQSRHALALHRKYHSLTGKSLSKYDLMRHLTKLKRLPKSDHWNMLDAQAAQDVIDRIDRAYKLFFRNHKAGMRRATAQVQEDQAIQLLHPETDRLQTAWRSNPHPGHNL